MEAQVLEDNNRSYLLKTLAGATFIIFFQVYMVAPLIPELSTYFKVSEQHIGLIVPAFLIPYGIATLFFGVFADRFGTKKVILTSFSIFAVFTALTATSQTVPQLIFWRMMAGIGASGVIPISLAWIGHAYPYEHRGLPIGYIFGAVAGGGAFGSFAGVFLESVIGWRLLFLLVFVLAVFVWILIIHAYQKVELKTKKQGLTWSGVFTTYYNLLKNPRGRNAYLYVMLNGIFHAGVYTWLAYYLQKVYDLNGWQIGYALLGYGIPGLIFGPLIGKLTDKIGRSKLIPIGLAVGACSAATLIGNIPLWFARVAIITLSLGFDLTQPLLAGIVTEVGRERSGQSVSVMAFMLFVGFGLGSYLFSLALNLGLKEALIIFSGIQFLLALIALIIFKHEHFKKQPAASPPVTVGA